MKLNLKEIVENLIDNFLEGWRFSYSIKRKRFGKKNKIRQYTSK